MTWVQTEGILAIANDGEGGSPDWGDLTLTLAPDPNSPAGAVSWNCTAAGGDKRFAPASCR